MVFTRLFSFILLGLATAHAHASPVVEIRDSPITLSIATHIKTSGGPAALIKADRARFAALRATHTYNATRGSLSQARAQFPISAKDAIVTYTCDIPIGSPPTSYTLLVDTGSSNTWIGAAKKYVITSTSHQTVDYVGVTYGSGAFSGREYTDTVRIGPATIKAQSIGVASFTRGFNGFDGILGIGPVALTIGTLSPDRTSPVPTVTDNLKSQGIIYSAQIGISFEPTTSTTPSTNGQLDFGGVDPYKFTAPLAFVPVTSVFPASDYWGITQGITYGPYDTILDTSSAGIVDTGTTLLYLPSDAFARYANITGGTPDPNVGLLRISPAQYAGLESLHFAIGDVTYEFTPNAQIWPRKLNTFIGGEANAIYLVAADSGSQTGSGLDFINGFTWLQRFYTVFDTDNNRIGFAATPHTHATTN